MSQTLAQDPSTNFVNLITFQWGDTPNVTRYCSGTQNLTVLGKSYTNAPEISIDFDKPNNIGTEDAPLKIKLKGNKAPLDTLTTPFPHAKVAVTVAEVDPLRESTFREVYFGHVSMVEAKLRGSHLLTTLTVAGIKSRLTQLVGIQALSTCIWQFGDENHSPCKVSLGPLRATGIITARAVGGNSVRIDTDLADDPYFPLEDVRWKGGYVAIDGNRVKIRQSLGDGMFDLKSAIPPSWVGKSAIFTPGCDKSITACRYWENEERFMGIGIGMPGANPVYSEKR